MYQMCYIATMIDDVICDFMVGGDYNSYCTTEVNHKIRAVIQCFSYE